MKKLFYLLLILCSLASCEHRELLETLDKHYIRVYFDEDIQNVSHGFYDDSREKPEYSSPDMLRVALCDTESGDMLFEEYLSAKGSDEYGNYIEGVIKAPPGIYHLMAYNFDTESTHVRDMYNYYKMQGYTNPISSRLQSYLVTTRDENNSQKVVYEPDHLFLLTEENLVIEHTATVDTLRPKNDTFFKAKTTVETYYFQVGVKGVHFVSSAVAILTGMAGSVQMHDATLPMDPVSLFFNLQAGAANKLSATSVAYASFHTFGRLETVDSEMTITFEFYTIDGRVQVEKFSLTDIFKTAQVQENGWIILDYVVEIDPPEITDDDGGGISPDVGEWTEIESEIEI